MFYNGKRDRGSPPSLRAVSIGNKGGGGIHRRAKDISDRVVEIVHPDLFRLFPIYFRIP